VLNAVGSSSGTLFQPVWTASDGGSIISGQGTLSPVVGSAGSYALLVTNQSNGCTAAASVQVGQNTVPPTVAIGQPQTLTCVQATVVLDGSASSQGPQFSVSWATSGGNIVSGQGTYAVTVNQPGNYLLEIQDQQNGCTASAQMLVEQNTAPPGALIAAPPLLHCNLPNISLNGSSPSGGNLTYAWSTSNGVIVSGNNSSAPVVAAAGSYALTVTDQANGCTSTAVQTVSAIPPPSFAFEVVQPDCFDPKGTLQIVTTTGGSSPYQYSASAGQQWSSLPVFDEVSPGTYTLLVSDANGCTASAQATVNPPFLPSIELTDVLKISQGDSILLTPLTNIPPAQIASWKWSPADGLSCADCWQPWAKPLRSQYYTVEATDANGCKATDRILIQVNRLRNIYPPTAFSPDGDGQNDLFTLYAKGVREIKRLSVFDRWGEEVFTRRNIPPNDDTLGWDGTLRGIALSPAVFVWMAEIEFLDGEVEIVYGDVTLVR
jgi:gliding motility-associated-like protein